MNRRERRDIRIENSREISQRPLRDSLRALCGKIFLLLALTVLVASCHPKRAPSRGCDCPGGGHGMLREKKTLEPVASIYPKDGIPAS